MKKSLIALSLLIIGSCTVVPEVAPLVDPAEIAKFAKTIEDAGLVFVKDGALAPFRIAPNGTYDDSQNITYQISQIIDDSTVSALSVDFGEQTHELLGGTFGVTFQAIAFQRATPEEILDFKNTIDPKELISEQGGTWAPFTIAPDGTYTTSGVTYEIARIVDENTLLVVKSTGGLETHKLVDTDFGRIDASGAVFEEVAFKRATDAEIEPLRTGVNNFIYQNHGAWEPFIIATDRTYTVNGVAYEIGKIIDGDSANPIALVAKDTGGDTGSIERHKLIASKFGPINEDDDDITILSFKGSTASEILAYLTTLSEYIFAKNNIWNPLPKTDNSYTDVNGKTYSIGRVDPATRSILVANSDGGIETHGIRESSFGELTLSAVSKEIAFQRASTSELSTFIASLNNFIFAKSGVWNLLTTTVNSYTDANNITYDIGKINGTTIEVISLANGIETHKLESEKLIKTSDATEIAFKGSTDSEINTFLDNLDTFIFAKDGIWKSVLLTDATASRGGTYDDVNNITYDIGQINGNNIKVVSADFGIETHKLENKKLIKTVSGTEIAFQKATTDEINILKGKLADFIFHNTTSGWTDLSITISATAPFLYIYKDAADITYEIGAITGNDIKVVKYNIGIPKAIETHTIELGTSFGSKIPSGGIIELAFKKIPSEIKDFAGKIDPKLRLKDSTTLFEIKPDGTYVDKDGNAYEIGRMHNLTSAEVSKASGVAPTITHTLETNGIRGDKYGRITALSDVIVNPVIAEVSPLDALIRELEKYSYAKDGEWKSISVDPATGVFEAHGNTAAHVDFTIDISSINLPAKTVSVSEAGGSAPRNIKYTDKEITPISGADRILAIIKSTDKVISDYSKDIERKNLLKSKDKREDRGFFSLVNGKWAHDGPKNYEIGRVDIIGTKTNVIASAEWAGIAYLDCIQTYGYREIAGEQFFGFINADDTIDTTDKDNKVFAELTTLDINVRALREKLAGFKYSTSSDWVDFPSLLIADKFGAYKYTVGSETYTITDINDAIDTVTTDKGIHKLLEASGQYGVSADGTTIPYGTEIAIKATDSSKISEYTGTLRAKNLIYADIGGVWNVVSIDGGTTIKLGVDSYKIVHIYPDTSGTPPVNRKILVSSATLRQEVHQFVDSVYLNYDPDGTTVKDELAYIKITPAEYSTFKSSIDTAVLKVLGTETIFAINEGGDYGKYTHAGITYQIGRYIDANTICVAIGKQVVEKHGIRTTSTGTQFGKIVDDGDDTTVDPVDPTKIIAEKNKLDALKTELKDYIYPKDGTWAEKFDKTIIAGTPIGYYTVDSVVYNITDIDTANWIVTTDTGDKHQIKDNIFGVVTGGKVDPTKVIALRRNTTDKTAITEFAEKIYRLNLTKKDDDSLFVIPSTGKILFGKNNYTIGRIIDTDTAIIVGDTSPMITEAHGLRDIAYGSIKPDDYTKLKTVIAEPYKGELLGGAISTGEAKWLDFIIIDRISYIAYADGGNGDKLTVKEYNESSKSWINVGSPFSDKVGMSSARNDKKLVSMAYTFDTGGKNPVLHIAYSDDKGKVRVKIYNKSSKSWTDISEGLDNKRVRDITLAFDKSDTLYLAYQRVDDDDDKYTEIKKYVGTTWIKVESWKEDVESINFAVHDTNPIAPSEYPATILIFSHDKSKNKFITRVNRSDTGWTESTETASSEWGVSMTVHHTKHIYRALLKDGKIFSDKLENKHSSNPWAYLEPTIITRGTNPSNPSMSIEGRGASHISYISDGSIVLYESYDTDQIIIGLMDIGTVTNILLRFDSAIPYIAYIDSDNGNRVSVRKFKKYEYPPKD